MDRSPIKLFLAYLSEDLADFFRHSLGDVRFEITTIPFKSIKDFLDETTQADIVFVQWDGRGNSGHGLMMELQKRPHLPRYVVTTSKIQIEQISTKAQNQLAIDGWFDIPNEQDRLRRELAQFSPDSHDDPSQEARSCGLTFTKEIAFPKSKGRVLIEEIAAHWSAREHRARTVTRIKDETLRSHVLFFAPDQARANELRNFLTDVKFKYHDEFTAGNDAILYMRGHTTDCLAVWYVANSKESEGLLRQALELRGIRRIPIVLIYPTEDDKKAFDKQCGDIFVDRFILFDRNREKVRTALIEAFDTTQNDHSSRQHLESLRVSAKEHPLAKAKSLNLAEAEAACSQIASEPNKKYWAASERLLAYARLRDANKFRDALTDFNREFKTSDAWITTTAARCQVNRDDCVPAAQALIQALPTLSDLTEDRLFRFGTIFVRSQNSESLKALLEYWWSKRERYRADHQFYFLLSRFAQLTNLLALERSALFLALRGDFLRNDYIDAYGQHLIATGHIAPADALCEILLQYEYFPSRKVKLTQLQSALKAKNGTKAKGLVLELLVHAPGDKYLLGVQERLKGTA